MHYCLNIITNEKIFALYVLLATFAKRFDFFLLSIKLCHKSYYYM